MLTINCISHFHTAVFLSCSLHDCMHLACVFVYIWAGRTHFGQILTESTNENFYVRPRKQVESWIPALQLATYWLEEEKNCKDFSKHQHFIYVYLTRSLSQLILGITFFFLSGFYFRSIHYSQESRERERVFVLNSSLPLPLASQTLRD